MTTGLTKTTEVVFDQTWSHKTVKSGDSVLTKTNARNNSTKKPDPEPSKRVANQPQPSQLPVTDPTETKGVKADMLKNKHKLR